MVVVVVAWDEWSRIEIRERIRNRMVGKSNLKITKVCVCVCVW